MQTPFYVTKTTPITREVAEALACELADNAYSARRNLQDMIDFFLSGPKTKTVPLSLGTVVRMKPSDDWYYATPPAGTVCLVSQVVLNAGDRHNEVRLEAASGGDVQRVSFPNHITDLSEWIEVL